MSRYDENQSPWARRLWRFTIWSVFDSKFKHPAIIRQIMTSGTLSVCYSTRSTVRSTAWTFWQFFPQHTVRDIKRRQAWINLLSSSTSTRWELDMLLFLRHLIFKCNCLHVWSASASSSLPFLEFSISCYLIARGITHWNSLGPRKPQKTLWWKRRNHMLKTLTDESFWRGRLELHVVANC